MKQQQTTPEQNKMIEHYQNQLIALLSMPEKEHAACLIEDGLPKQDAMNQMQKIRSLLVSELRFIEKWKKNKISLKLSVN